MSAYTLSVAQLCPDAARDTCNRIAELAGYGPNNLSRRLIAADGSVWWGCLTYWTPEALAASSALPLDPETGAPIAGAADALAQVRTYVRGPGAEAFEGRLALAEETLGIPDAATTWSIALETEGLLPDDQATAPSTA